MQGTHEHAADPRNEAIQIDINGTLVARADAKISVFDSGFILGDGVWEGLRVERGTILFLEQHLQRLFEGMVTLDFAGDVTRDELSRRLYRVLAANGMHDGVHVRLMVSRGVKSTPYQDPRVTVTPPTVVIIAEHKSPTAQTVERGVRLYTVYTRRGAPDVQDPVLNTHSKLNCIVACIQAAKAGADEALMLDPHGFVATCNSTHFFVVRNDELWTSSGNYCLDGITRRNVLEVAGELGVVAREKNFSLHDVYNATEAFVTGTFAGLVPVTEVDGRTVGSADARPMLARLRAAYRARIDRYIAEQGPLHAH
jgi:branched-chain amino acid aminotransferase